MFETVWTYNATVNETLQQHFEFLLQTEALAC